MVYSVVQMDYVEFVDGEWRLHLEDLLNNFGRNYSNKMVLETDSNGSRIVKTNLWGKRYSIELLAMDRNLFDWSEDEGPTTLTVRVFRNDNYASNEIVCRRLVSKKDGTIFYCKELDMDIDSKELAQLIEILGSIADDFVDWRPYEQLS